MAKQFGLGRMQICNTAVIIPICHIFPSIKNDLVTLNLFFYLFFYLHTRTVWDLRHPNLRIRIRDSELNWCVCAGDGVWVGQTGQANRHRREFRGCHPGK